MKFVCKVDQAAALRRGINASNSAVSLDIDPAMNRGASKSKFLLSILPACLLILHGEPAKGSIFLTGGIMSSVDASGNVAGNNAWSLASDGNYNLWLKIGGLYGTSFYNGPSDAQGAPNIELLPGTYQIGLLAEPGPGAPPGVPYHGLNLSFNGGNPSYRGDISVFGPDLTSAGDTHYFWANSASWAGGTLTYIANGLRVTVVDYYFAPPEVFMIDQVGPESTGPSGVWDRAGSITLQVEVVPEPSTYLAGALLLFPFGLQGIKILRNRKQTV